ncbi:MAG: hypothetical protein ACLQJ0_06080 [Steroidobacteraceae bacterium]
MISPASLGLWLQLAPAEHAKATADLITSTDLRVMTSGDLFGLERTHGDLVTHLETGVALPMMRPAHD